MPSASTPEILDALAGKRTLDQAWEGVMIPSEGRQVPGWQCRACGWRIGTVGLPPNPCGQCHAPWDRQHAEASERATELLDALAPPLHVYYLSTAEEWWVATSAEDAKRQALALWGGKWEDYADDGDEFERCDDTLPLKIVCDSAEGHPSDSGPTVTRTCREWAEREGPGPLCSQDY